MLIVLSPALLTSRASVEGMLQAKMMLGEGMEVRERKNLKLALLHKHNTTVFNDFYIILARTINGAKFYLFFMAAPHSPSLSLCVDFYVAFTFALLSLISHGFGGCQRQMASVLCVYKRANKFFVSLRGSEISLLSWHKVQKI